MKKMMLLFLFFKTIPISAQDYYPRCDVITVDGITYKIELGGVDVVHMDNIENKLGDENYVFLDGTLYEPGYEVSGLAKDRPGTIATALKKTFTAAEYNNIHKIAQLNCIFIGYVVNTEGNVLEVDFNFSGAALHALPPSKFAQLEKNLKKYVKFDVSEEGKKLKFTYQMSIVNFGAVDLYPTSDQLTPTDPTPSDPGFRKGGGEVRGN